MSRPDLVTTSEAARMLKRSIRTIHRAVRDGVLVPAMRLSIGPNGSFVFERADVERLAKARALGNPKTDIPLAGLDVHDGDKRKTA